MACRRSRVQIPSAPRGLAGGESVCSSFDELLYTRSQHKWSEDQLAHLAENPSAPRSVLVAGFPDFAGSDQSIVGRRFGLVNQGSKRNPALNVAAIEVRIAECEQDLASLKEQLKKAKRIAARAGKGAPKVMVETLVAITITDLRAAAEMAGFKANGSKEAIAKRIVAA